MKSLVFATTNAGKLAELKAMLGPPWVVHSSSEFPAIGEVAETADSFAGNAELKARALCAATGLLSVGDDSGLCVDALGGRPGVLSARYAASDAERNSKLLAELAGVSLRTAYFECALCAVWPSGRVERAIGVCRGAIAFSARGEQGFGYDPIFEMPGGITLAEMTREQKAQVSHRGAAFRALASALHDAR